VRRWFSEQRSISTIYAELRRQNLFIHPLIILNVHIEFTQHAKDRMKKRNISEDEVISTIKYPEKTEKVNDVYYVQKHLGRFSLIVVYIKENYIKVITLYPI